MSKRNINVSVPWTTTNQFDDKALDESVANFVAVKSAPPNRHEEVVCPGAVAACRFSARPSGPAILFRKCTGNFLLHNDYWRNTVPENNFRRC